MAMDENSEEVVECKLRDLPSVNVGLHKSRFKTVVSTQAQHPAHSCALETTAVFLALKWLARIMERIMDIV